MLDNDPIDGKTCGTMLVIILCSMLFVIGGCGLLIARVAADDHPLCSYFAELANLPEVEVAQWIGYPDGWQDYPTVWDYETWTDLANGSGILTRSSEGKRWLWGFRSLTEDNGNHDFCEHVLIVDDSP